jgi:hypothetical protein
MRQDLDPTNILTQFDMVEQHATATDKIVVYIRADGPRMYPDKAQAVWDLLEETCDINVKYALMQYGEVYCYFNSVNQARNTIEEWFPEVELIKNDQYDLGEEFYFHVYGMGPNGQAIVGR